MHAHHHVGFAREDRFEDFSHDFRRKIPEIGIAKHHDFGIARFDTDLHRACFTDVLFEPNDLYAKTRGLVGRPVFRTVVDDDDALKFRTR